MTIIRTFPIQLRLSTVEAPLISQTYEVPAGLTEIKFRANIPTAAYENTANSFDLAVEEETTPGIWVRFSGLSWSGGHFEGKGGVNPPPTKTIPAAALVGKTVRMSLVVPVEMLLGGTIATEP